MNLPQIARNDNPVAAIVAAYDAQPARYVVIHQTDAGKVLLHRNLRGDLVLQHFPAVSPAPSVTPLIVESHTGRQADEAETREWLADVAELFSLALPAPAPAAELPEPTPPTPDPVEAAAADLLAEYANHPRRAELVKRVAAAVELVQAGRVDFPEHETSQSLHGLHGRRHCLCGDARFRALTAKFGTACKHTLAQELAQRIEREAEQVASRHLVDTVERRRTALPASVDQRQGILDALGYEPDYSTPEQVRATIPALKPQGDRGARWTIQPRRGYGR